MKTEKHWHDVFAVAIKEVDVVMEILDSRNPLGTHNQAIERFIQKSAPHIRLILVLNKSDIIPKNVLKEWVWHFQKAGYDVISTSAKYRGGITTLLKRLRGYKQKFNRELCAMAVGYPNTGKSTLLQALSQNEKKLGTSSKAGFTRAIQKIKISQDLYLLDSPGVVPFDDTNETEIALKSCMMADKLDDPLAVVEAIFTLLPYSQFNRIYDINLTKTDGVDELIDLIGHRLGRLRSGGVVDENAVIKRLIRDWQSNTLRYYVLPPALQEHDIDVTSSRKSIRTRESSFPKSLKNTQNQKKQKK